MSHRRRHHLEALEPRILLTTLFGGEVFEYRSPDPLNPEEVGPIVRIMVDGQATLELIAADIDDANQAVLGDMPGVITQSDLGRAGTSILGGIGGQDGVDLIGSTPIVDPQLALGNIPFVADGNDDLDLQALATNDDGETFAFNVPTVALGDSDDRQLIQLVQLSNTTGDATVRTSLQQATLAEDVMANLSLTIGDVQAFAIDPTSHLAYAVSGADLFQIDRTTGVVTFVGPISSGGFTFAALPGVGAPDAEIVGYASDADGIFYSIFDDTLLNNALLASRNPADPNPVAAVNGDFGGSFNFVALAIGATETDPGFAVHDGGGVLELYELPRDDGSITGVPGAVGAPALIGVIQDAGGNIVTGIAALDRDSRGGLYGVGTRGAASPTGGQEVFLIDATTAVATLVTAIRLPGGALTEPITALAFDAEDQLHVITRIGDQDVLIRIPIDFNALPSASAQLTAPGTVSPDLVGFTSFIDPAGSDPEHGRFYSVFDDNLLNNFLATSSGSGDTGGDGHVDDFSEHNPLTSVNGDLGPLDLDFIALTASANDADPAFAINNGATALELVQINRLADGSLDPDDPFVTLGQITDPLGNAITDSNALEMDAAGTLYTIGFNTDAPVPVVSVGGTLGGQFDLVGLAALGTGDAVFAVDLNAVTGSYELYAIVRDPDTGQLAQPPTLIQQIRDAGNAPIRNIHAVETHPVTGAILVVGTRDAGPDMELFEVNSITAIAQSRGTLMADIDGDGTATPLTDQVTALAMANGGPAGTALFAVVRDTSSGIEADRLLELSLLGPGGEVPVIDRGLIQTDVPLAGTGTLLDGFDFTVDGDLLGNDKSQGPGEHRFVQVDVDDPTQSVVRTTPLQNVVIDDNLTGLTSDSEGRFLAIRRDAVADDELWINASRSLLTLDPTPADLDGDGLPDEIQATPISILNVAGGRVTTDPVNALAYDAADDLFYAVERSFLLGEGAVDRLISIDPNVTQGGMLDIGLIRVGGTPTALTALDFTDTRTLVGVNTAGGRGAYHLVEVDLAAPDTDSAQLTPLGSISGDLTGFYYGGAGLAFSLFDRDVMNDALVSGLGDHVPLPIGPFGGAANDLDVVATTIIDDPGDADDGRIFVVHDNGAAFELHEITFNADGSVDQYVQVGTTIQDVGLTDVTDIHAIAFDAPGEQLIIVGLDATVSATDRRVFTFPLDADLNVASGSMPLVADGAAVTEPVTALAQADDGTVYAVRDAGGVDVLQAIDPASGAVTPVGIGSVLVNGLPTRIAFMDFDGIGQLIAADDPAGSADQRRSIVVNTTQPNNSRPHTEPGTLAADLRGLGARQGRFVSILDGGPDADTLALSGNVPLAFVDGDLGDDFQTLALTVDSTGRMYSIVDNQGTLELHTIERDATTGDAAAPLRLGDITDASGLPVSNIHAIDAEPATDDLYVVGLASPIPSATVGGDLGGDFDVVALDQVSATQFDAVQQATAAGMDVQELIRITRDPLTGAVTDTAVVGEIRDASGNRILGIEAMESGTGVFGFNADAPAPTASVGEIGGPGALIGAQVFHGFAVTASDQFYGVVENGPAFDLVQLVRDPGTGAVSQFEVRGTIRDEGGTALAFVDDLFADHPTAANAIYIIATSAGGQELFKLNANTAVATSIDLLSANGLAVNDVYDELLFTPDGQTLIATLVDPDANTTQVFYINPGTGVVTTGPTLTDTQVVAMDFSERGPGAADDELLAIIGADGARQLAIIDLAAPLVTAITEVGAPDGPGPILVDGLFGYQLDRSGRGFSIFDNAGNAELWINGSDLYGLADNVATYLQTLTINRDFGAGGGPQPVAVTGSINALGVLADGTTFAVLHDNGIDRLVNIGAPAPTSGVDTVPLDFVGGTADSARILVNGVDTAIQGMAPDGGGRMIALNALAAAANHMLLLDLAAPGLSRQLTPFGSAGGDLRGFTSDQSNRFYSINDAAPNELWVNPLQLFQITTEPVDIDNDTVEDEVVAILIGALSDGTSQVTEDITALAWNEEGTRLFAVRDILGGETLIRIDPDTAAIETVSQILVDGLPADVQAMDINIDGHLVAMDDSLGPDLRRLILLAIPGEVESLGVVMIDGQDTQIAAMDFDSGDRLAALDDSQGAGARRLVEVSVTDPPLSTALAGSGPVSENLAGFSFDAGDRAYALFVDDVLNSALYVNSAVTPGDLSPLTSVNRDLDANLDFVALTVAPDDRVFAIDNPAPDQFDLYRLDDDTASSTSAVRLGRVTTSAGAVISDINALEAHPATGLLTFVGRVGAGQILFTLDQNQVPTDADGDTFADEMVAATVGALTLDGAALSDPVNALAYRSAQQLLGVLRPDAQDVLIEIDPGDGQVTQLGIIEVDDANTFIVGMDARDTDGDQVPDDLVAIDRAGNQIIVMTETEGTVVAGPEAMAFDLDGELFIITRDYEPTVDASDLPIGPAEGDAAEGPKSPLDVALIQVDKTRGNFDEAVDVQIIVIDGFEVTHRYTAMAFQTNTTLYAAARVVGDNDEASSVLHRMNVGGGGGTVDALPVGAITIREDADDQSGDATLIDGLAFAINRSEQEILAGLDNGQIDEDTGVVSARLVSISTTSGQASALSEPGAIGVFGGLAGLTETGDRRPLIFTTDGDDLIRGSVVSMPLDGSTGASTVSSLLAADFEPGSPGTAVIGIDTLSRFPGLDFSDGGGWVPPDTSVAAGPGHIVEVVNRSVGIFERTGGALLLNQSLGALFAGLDPGPELTDPLVLYDDIAERFLVAALEVDAVARTAFLLYAVSDSDDPLDGFTETHRITAHEPGLVFFGTSHGDFTRAGYNADAHVFTLNMMSFDNGLYDHTSVISIDKTAVLDQDPVGTPLVPGTNLFEVDRDDSNFTMVPAVMHDAVAGDPMWLLAADAAANRIRVTRMDDVLSASPVFAEANIVVAAFDDPTAANQPGAGQFDTSDARMLSVAWRDGRLVGAHTVDTPGNTAAVRWYEFSTATTPALAQTGEFDQGPGVWAFFPAIEINALGDLGMTFMQSSESQFLSMMATGQQSGDPAGTMRAPVRIKAGEATYASTFADDPFLAGRHGGISVDPVDGRTFWAAHEYATSLPNNNWGTFIGSFQVIEPTVTPDVQPGLLHLVAASGEDGINLLYTLDTSATSRSAIQNSLVQVPGSFGVVDDNARQIVSVAWDQTGTGNVLVGYDALTGSLATVDTVNVSGTGYGPTVTRLSEAVTNISAIEFAEASPVLAETIIYAVQNEGADSRLLRVHRGTGTSYVLGPLHDPDDIDSPLHPDHTSDDDGPVRGEDLAGMAWNELLFNPFTGAFGALIATDASSDELVIVDHRKRFPTADVFAVYVSQASDDADFVIAALPPDGIVPRDMWPFTESIGALRIFPADGSGNPTLLVDVDDATGNLYIGARTEEIYPDIDDEDRRPISRLLLAEEMGVRAAGVDDIANAAEDLSSGITVAPNLLEYFVEDGNLAARVLGSNFDEVDGLAISRDGTLIVAVDVDGVDQAGQFITPGGPVGGSPRSLAGLTLGDQVAFVDPVLGTAGTPVNVTNAASGALLEDIQGLDFGDPDFDGVEELYAVYDLGGSAFLGRLDAATGQFAQIGLLGLAPDSPVAAMAFSPQGDLWIVDGNTSDLYEVEFATGADGAISAVTGLRLVGPIVDEAGNALLITAMDFDRNGGLFAHDAYLGRLVDVSPATALAAVGSATATGSLRPTVGDISFDFAADRFMAVDNAPGLMVLSNETVIESAALMTLVGTASDASAVQNMDRVFVGGALSGRVSLHGSVDTFYAGWLLTGETIGQPEGAPYLPDNFHVGGHLRNLITTDSIGTNDDGGLTDPVYLTGFDLTAGGRVGQIRTYDSFAGSVAIDNLPTIPALSGLQTEIEHKPSPGENEGRLFQGLVAADVIDDPFEDEDDPDDFFDTGILTGPKLWRSDGLFDNDTFDTAQALGAIRSGPTHDENVIRLNGLVNADTGDLVDYYSVGLMAGATYTVQLLTLGFLPLYIGVFDPDGRLIASDYSNQDPLEMQNAPFRFTADRPGEYRFAIAFPGDALFDGNPSLVLLADDPYLLLVEDVGNIALGSLRATNSILGMAGGAPMSISHGDLAALRAGQYLIDDTGVSWVVSSGDLRSVEADRVGTVTSPSLEFDVPNGSVGLVRGSSGVIFNFGLFAPIIGGDFQVIDSGGGFIGSLLANGGIGVVRTGGDVGSVDGAAGFTRFAVNVDAIGADGIIDLIDVGGDLLGPAIDTGPGGNVRYIRVGGEVLADPAFSSGLPTSIVLSPGESFTVTDDSGGQLRFTPMGEARDGSVADDGGGDAGGAGDAGAGPAEDTSIRLTMYGIAGSGGSVVVNATINGSVEISSQGFGNDAPVEISQLVLVGEGSSVLTTADGHVVFEDGLDAGIELAADDEDQVAAVDAVVGPTMRARIVGNSPIDVFSVLAATAVTTGPFNDTTISAIDAPASLTSFTNRTGGELVNFFAGSVGRIFSTGPIGLPRHHTGAAIVPLATAFERAVLLGDLPFPFLQQNHAIRVDDIYAIRSDMGIGNVVAAGSIERVVANDDKVDDPAAFEGIAGPVTASGNINYVQIGEGLAESGTGQIAHAGLFAGDSGSSQPVLAGQRPTTGVIGAVRNQGLGSDIRGDIYAANLIERIVLHDGAIINAEIITDVARESTIESNGGFVRITGPDTLDRPVLELEEVTLTGAGGIIGSIISAPDIGPITVRNGFGIFNSQIFSFANNNIANVIVDGFGIRDVVITPGATMADIVATGKGTVLQTSRFTPSVRPSETEPFFANRLTDLASFLGAVDDITGVIADVLAQGTTDLGTVSAYQIRDTVLNFANSIKTIRTLDTIEQLSVITGRLGLFRPAADVISSELTVAGDVRKVQIHGSFRDSSTFFVSGPNGNIRNFRVTGDMDGALRADGTVGTFQVDGNLTGDIVVRGTNGARVALNKFKLGGALTNGSLDVNGNVGTIEVVGGLGSAGDGLIIRGNLKSIKVGTSRSAAAASVALDLTVLGDVGTFQALGMVSGDVVVQGGVRNFAIAARANTIGTSILTGNVTILGEATKVAITDGHIGPDVSFIAGTSIKRFTVTNGSIMAGASIATTFGDIRDLTIKGGDLSGSVSAPNGSIDRLTVMNGADFGDGIHAAAIRARSAGKLQFSGSVMDGAVIEIAGAMDDLTVAGDLAAGASVSSGSAPAVKIGRDMLGTMALGDNRGGTRLTVARHYGGTTRIAADASLDIGGDVAAGTTISISRNLEKFTVEGTVYGDVFVDGSGGKWAVGALDGVVLTTGFDLEKLTVAGNVDHALIQAGISRGADGVFSSTIAGRDFGEESRLARIGRVSAHTVTNALFASAGDFGQLDVAANMILTSASSGFSVGSTAIAGVIADPTPLLGDIDHAAARGGVDRALLHGDFNSVSVGAFLSKSTVSAGVDPGDDGRFGTADDGLLFERPDRRLPEGGGHSRIGTISGTGLLDVRVLADSGVQSNQTSGTLSIDENVGYDIAALTTDLGNPVEPLVGTVTVGAAQTFDGITIRLNATDLPDATIEVHDSTPGDNRIDTLLLRGPHRDSDIVVGGGGRIGRILTEDDVQVRRLNYDGTLAGDGIEATPDLWIDATGGAYAFDAIADRVTGRIAGNVDGMSIDALGDALLQVTGTVNQFAVVDGTGGNGLLTDLGPTPSDDLTLMSTDAFGNTWVFDAAGGRLSAVDPATGAILSGPFDVVDDFTGQPLSLEAMDFGNDLLAVAELFNANPTRLLGGIADPASASIDLRGMAVSPEGRILAIQNDGVDRLVELDAGTGQLSPVGELRDVFANPYGAAGAGQVLQLAFDATGGLFGLVADRDGAGDAFTAADGAALVRIEPRDTNDDGVVLILHPTLPFRPGVLLDDGGPVTDDFTAMAIDGGGTIHAIRRAGSEDHLVTIDLDAMVTTIGPVRVDGADTGIIGMGFTASDMLYAYDNDGLAAQLIAVDSTLPATASRPLGEPGLLDPRIDAFGVSRADDPATFAYDTGDNFDDNAQPVPDGDADDPGDFPGGRFFASPGLTRMLGALDLLSGRFERRAGLSVDEHGTPLPEAVVAMAVDNAATGHVFVLTVDSRLLEVDAADGSFISVVGTVTDPDTGRTISVTDIEFDDDAGALLAVDGDLNRLLTVDTATATVAPRLEPGALRDAVAGIAFDATTGTLRGIDGERGQFVAFNGTTQDALQSGLLAHAVHQTQVTGAGTFTGRLATTGAPFTEVEITGDFEGSLVTHVGIGRLQLDGDFAGTVLSDRDIGQMWITGDVRASGIVQAGMSIGRISQEAGDFAGFLQARFADTWEFDGAGTPGSDLLVLQDAGTIAFSGGFDGAMELGNVGRALQVDGPLGPAADIRVHDRAARLDFAGGTAAGSRATVDGRAASVTVRRTHSGMVAAAAGMDRVVLDDVTLGLVAAGRASGSLKVTGVSDGAVYSFGASLGPDRIYNTNDDVLSGGSLASATFQGDYVDSVLAVGVLPSVAVTSSSANNLPDDNRVYAGDAAAQDIAVVDSAEAGGLFSGSLGRLSLKGQIRSSAASAGRQSAVVTAGGIGRQQRSAFGIAKTDRAFGDPNGAPTLVETQIVDETEVRIIFSEPMNTASFVLARDGNDDGDVLDAADTPGSVILRDDQGRILDDPSITLRYTTRTTAEGDTQGVLRVVDLGGLGQNIAITLVGRTVNAGFGAITQDDLSQTPTLFDQSALRSVLRDLNQDGTVEVGEDVFGTIFDGDRNGLEGGSFGVDFSLQDVPDDFAEALERAPVDVVVDGGSRVLTTAIEATGDVDVFRLRADAHRFLRVDVTSEHAIQMAAFVRDNQGTPDDPADDTFEMLARWEDNVLDEYGTLTLEPLLDAGQTAVYELPPVADAAAFGGWDTTELEYFITVSSPQFLFSTDTGTYQLTLTLTSTDAAQGTLPPGEQIAYVSNTIAEHGNLLGANEPRQLVYLDFDGGTVDQVAAFEGRYVAPFDASTITPLLAGREEVMINGGTDDDGDPIAGIVELVAQVYQDSPDSHPLGRLHVEVLDDDLAPFLDPAAEGLFLTTVDPALSGLDPAEDFTSLRIGQVDAPVGLYGLADGIDLANMSKRNEAIIFVQNFALLNFAISEPGNIDTLTREFAEAIAGTTAHELGHLLGLNHTLRNTIIDDPDNDGDATDSVPAGLLNLIAAGPDSVFPDDFLALPYLGTSRISTDEFPSIGGTGNQQASIDVLTNLLFWLS